MTNRHRAQAVLKVSSVEPIGAHATVAGQALRCSVLFRGDQSSSKKATVLLAADLHGVTNSSPLGLLVTGVAVVAFLACMHLYWRFRRPAQRRPQDPE